VASYDGTKILLYLNASVAAAGVTTRSLTSLATPFTVGTDSQTSLANSDLAGFIDEVAIYDKALSAGRVTAHYQAGTAK
jgi:hypothetical protein